MAAETALNTAQTQAASLAAQKDQLVWVFEELKQVAAIEGEWQALEEEHKRLSHSAQLITNLQSVLDALESSDNAMTEQSRGLLNTVQGLEKFDPTTKSLAEPIETAYIHLQEAARGISQYLKRADLDPERLSEVELRISSLHAVARKLRIPAAELPQKFISVGQELALLNSAQDLDALTQNHAAMLASYNAAATELSATRTKAASQLARAVTNTMQALALSGGQFDVRLGDAAPSVTGIDSVDFLVTANLGQPLRPLAKVASGGELARMSLAICVVTAAQTAVPCLIFDEVDSGIGGATADIVGQNLRELGVNVQVLAVTHLAQVAANAHHQLKVAKSAVDGKTVSTVTKLDEPGRVDEIARMLGGENITVTTRYHAQELLTAAFHRHKIN